ncbi:MAG: HAD family hydrolase [Hyphomicrobiales bacterium]|nr:HAD family hydrolase [Hyphomicrobiales bacterium]MCP4997279.1 HAD family hydrolase [Hyphomicrobiales bacterium]
MITPTPARKFKAVLFDKDGTLFAFTETWANFCDRVFDKLVGSDEAQKDALAAACGYDRARRRFKTGSLIVNGSAHEVNAAWLALLPEINLSRLDAVNREILTDLPIVPTCDLHAVLGALREEGFVLGVATNDYVAGALGHLHQAGALSLFDFVCGSDSGYGSKPGPGMVRGFCEEVGITPDELILVGDSKHDMDCGVNAGAGLLVGVLTGPAQVEDLEPHAHVVLPSIGELPAFLAR